MFLFSVPVGALGGCTSVHVCSNEHNDESQEEMARRKLCDPNPQLQPELWRKREQIIGDLVQKSQLECF